MQSVYSEAPANWVTWWLGSEPTHIHFLLKIHFFVYLFGNLLPGPWKGWICLLEAKLCSYVFCLRLRPLFLIFKRRRFQRISVLPNLELQSFGLLTSVCELKTLCLSATPTETKSASQHILIIQHITLFLLRRSGWHIDQHNMKVYLFSKFISSKKILV